VAAQREVLAQPARQPRKHTEKKMANKQPARSLSIILSIAALAFVCAIAYLVVGAPRGLVGYRTAFETLRLLAQIGAGGAVASLIVLVLALRSPSRAGARLSAISLLVFAIPVGTMIANEATPPPGDFINDITTDLEDPPIFSAVIPLRPEGSSAIEYGGAEVAEIQRQAHPDVEPILTELAGDAAFQKAFETAEMMGWEVVSGDMQTGIIEAIDTTPFFRFKDDIVIRIRPAGGGSRIDLRSKSRVGLSDLGTNAKRIRKYADAFEG
jgi:uncharacterized protein (DUF1499 family)